ncbi:hypothetical protein K2173_015676 [Erythroxylum novogranatense]|uniref:Dof zinc finger protein n=1 Tax=Erythroxylum novogranatense TaxID=1862640 RepID=A0AAV8SER5_9ROSI|nr:hypothetical protein K2173_015676 [Erythroxylum novogranatense]
MVFSSVPVYLDPPNWQQQPNQQLAANHESPLLPPLPPPPHVGGGGGGRAGSIRPGSMADRARLANLPQPEVALKCPRCDSSNTKFCYYNNYSLSQPRHFCKTCRRYWTRGGALRNVPVGGGCRRNKKNRSQSSSKSAASGERQVGSRSSNSTDVISSENIIGHSTHQQSTQLPLMILHNLTESGAGNFRLNFGEIQGQIGGTNGANGQTDMGFQLGSNPGMSSGILSAGETQQLGLVDPPSTGLYPFHSNSVEQSSSVVGETHLLRPMNPSSRVSHWANVKMEHNEGLSLARPFLALPENNQFWSGNMWTDLSGFNASSSSHFL